MKFELWHDTKDDSYALVQALSEKPSEKEQRSYKFLTAGSELKKEFEAKDFDEAVEMRNKFLGW
jgi:hypothetical protein